MAKSPEEAVKPACQSVKSWITFAEAQAYICAVHKYSKICTDWPLDFREKDDICSYDEY